MTLGNFFIVGAQRSATTYLYSLLDPHPQIEMAKPLRPEPKVFLTRNPPVRGAQDYLSRVFPEYAREDPEKLRFWLGEKSTSYYETRGVAEHIARVFPLARIIFLLRDPIDRALSNYRFSKENGLEKREVNEALIADLSDSREPARPVEISVSPFTYVKRGEYSRFLREYLEVFPKRQICVMQTEMLVRNLEAFHSILDFLSLEPSDIGKNAPIIRNVTQATPDEISPDIVSMLRSHYARSNAWLEEQFGLDLSIWTRCSGGLP